MKGGFTYMVPEFMKHKRKSNILTIVKLLLELLRLKLILEILKQLK